MKNFLAVLIILIMSPAVFASPTSFLFDAVMSSETTAEQVQAIIKSGADVNIKTYQGVTPLMLAAKKNNQAAMKILIDSGADIYAEDDEGRTAIYYAGYDAKKIILDAIK